MRDRLMLEYPEKMCEYCCNFDKEHIGMDGMTLCKLTMTLAYAEDYGGNCMFYNVPKEQIFVPPCKVGDTLWVRWSLSEGHKKDIYPVKVYALRFDTKKNNMRVCVEGHFKITAYGGSYTHYYNGTFAWNSVGKTVFLTKEEAEKALERSNK